MVRLFALITSVRLMSGCDLKPKIGTQSEELKIADAMSVPAEGMPQAKYSRMMTERGDGKNINNTISGATKIIATGDPTMFLLGGLAPHGISANIQFVAWVPKSIVTTEDEAVSISSKAFIEANANVCVHETRRSGKGYWAKKCAT